MSWLVLIASGMMEAVWARALSASQSFRRPVPILIFLVAISLSLAGLAWAMRTIPTGTAYAVWTGIGASLTVIWAVLRGEEQAGWTRLGLITLLLVGVIGLKVVS